MTIYAAYNAGTDKIEGIYDDGTYTGTVPTPNITITQGALDTALALQEAGGVLYRSGTAIVDGAVAPDLATYKETNKRIIDAQASQEVRSHFDYPAEIAIVELAKVREADYAEHTADASMSQANYPLLAAEVDSDGDTINHANLSAKGTAVQAAWLAKMVLIEGIEKERLDTYDAIDAAGTNGAVDTAVGAVAWPV
jgi:hypothetical protein